MKSKTIKRKVNINRNNSQWKLYQQFRQFATMLDTLPDAARVQANPHRSAPLALTDMVF